MNVVVAPNAQMRINSKLPHPTLAAVLRSAFAKRIDWLRPRLRTLSSLEVPASYSLLFYLSVFLVGFLIIFSRRPDAILNAQFWAEDGQRWYADAYHFGLRCLLMPDELGGYFHSVSRLSGLLALLVPLSFAPLVMNLFAIVIQILPANVFLSSPFSAISFPKRLAAAFVYFALPNTYEVNANATTIQWHLGLLACLLLLAPSTRSWKWHVFDGVVLVLISLDSPVGVVLLPLAAVVWWMRRG